MKLSCSQIDLKKGLAVVQRAVPRGTSLDILDNILFDATDSEFTLTGTDLSMRLSCKVPAEIEQAGSVLVPAKTTADLVNNLPDGQISLNLDKLILSVDCDRSANHIRGRNPDDFPAPSTDNKEVNMEINPGVLESIIKHVTFAAATDESRPVLTGVNTESSQGSLLFVSADGFRLSKYNFSSNVGIINSFSDGRWIIPARTLNVLAWCISRSELEDNVKVYSSSDQENITFDLQDIVLTSQLLFGDYPDCQQLLLCESKTSIIINREALINACKVAKVMAERKRIKLTISESGLTIHSQSLETGQSTIAVDYKIFDGESMEVFCNVDFLLQSLNVIDSNDSGNVSIDFQDPLKPVFLRSTDNDCFVHVLMPMHLA